MKKTMLKALCLITAALMLAAVIPLAALAKTAPETRDIWDGSVAEGFAGGSGTAEDPYLISSGAELAYLAEQVNAGESYEGCLFELTDDIYLNDTEGWEDWSAENPPANMWTPIGWAELCTDGVAEWHEMKWFKGSFNGGGHAIYGLFTSPESEAKVTSGLFGCMYEAAVSGISVLESCVIGNYTCAGIVAWGADVSVYDSSFQGMIESGSSCGGIFGHIEAADDCISNCVSVGVFEGTEAVGGIAGNFSGTGISITNCKANCLVYSEGEAGGIAGELSGRADYCMAAGQVIGEVTAGGLIGSLWNSVRHSYNLASVMGLNAGGIAGSANDAGISDSYNCGSVEGIENTGGIFGMGYQASLRQCYNVGTVTGGEATGALFGFDYEGSSNCQNCFCLEGCTEGQHIGAFVLTEEQMTDASNYEEFDFENVWTMDGNSDYPYAELIDNPHITIDDEEPVLPGDVDDDGEVTVADALLALRASMGLVELNDEQQAAANVDGDEEITVADALLILRASMGLLEL